MREDARAEGPSMRAAYVAVTSVVFTGVLLLGLFLLSDLADPGGWSFWLSTVAVFLLIFPAVLLGAFVQWWPVEPRGQVPAHLRRRLLILIGAQVTGAVLALGATAAAGAALLRPTSLIVVVAVLSVGNFFLARGVRRSDDRTPPAPSQVWDQA